MFWSYQESLQKIADEFACNNPKWLMFSLFWEKEEI